MKTFKSTFTRKLSKKKNARGAKKQNWKKGAFKFKWLVDDFKAYYNQNRAYIEERFETFFNRIINMWEKDEFVLEFKKREFDLLKSLGLKNDFVYLQLLSDLGELGIDLQTFVILCIDALLNQDEEFKTVIMNILGRRKEVLNIKGGKEIFKKLKEQREKDKKNFEKFSYQIEEK